jgi:dipeptidase
MPANLFLENNMEDHVMKKSVLIALAFVFIAALPLAPCTNYLVTKGASKDGSTIVSYSADSHNLYGELYRFPAGIHQDNTLIGVYEWDTGKYLGQIKQVPRTYSVVGNINEYQVVIGETTFGGREELRDPKGGIDYGSMIYLGLQRARTAREAIQVMTGLATEYSYYSEGETFSISDPNEAWLLEMVGKGKDKKGAVWVAVRIPDGYISAHANCSRIGTFAWQKGNNWADSRQTVYHAPDVISFAREMGYFKGQDKDFSFCDTYAPADFGAIRFCEARVWEMFRRAAPSLHLSADLVKGQPPVTRLPLWIKPDKPLGVRDVMDLMRDHFEGSEFDMTKDVGAGPFKLPYRWRPMTWKVDGQEYLHERAVSTQQTGFSFVAQSRSWLPGPIGGVLWFGVDDTYSTVYMPMYCGMRDVPACFAVGTGAFNTFTWDSGFWVFNFVSNYCYLRYSDMIQDVQTVQRELEGHFMAMQADVEATALGLYKSTPELARNYLTEYSCKEAETVVKRWKKLGEFLIFKYLDGNVKDELNQVTHPPYPETWYRQIIKDAGARLKVAKEEPKK